MAGEKLQLGFDQKRSLGSCFLTGWKSCFFCGSMWRFGVTVGPNGSNLGLDGESLIQLFEVRSEMSFPSCASHLLHDMAQMMFYGLQLKSKQENPAYVMNNFVSALPLAWDDAVDIVLGVGLMLR